jgi:hypothetical protein
MKKRKQILNKSFTIYEFSMKEIKNSIKEEKKHKKRYEETYFLATEMMAALLENKMEKNFNTKKIFDSIFETIDSFFGNSNDTTDTIEPLDVCERALWLFKLKNKENYFFYLNKWSKLFFFESDFLFDSKQFWIDSFQHFFVQNFQDVDIPLNSIVSEISSTSYNMSDLNFLEISPIKHFSSVKIFKFYFFFFFHFYLFFVLFFSNFKLF